MMRSSARPLVLLLATTVACQRPRGPYPTPTDEQIRVQFPAREVRGTFPDGVPVVLQEVVRVEGYLTRIQGDTVVLRLMSVRRESGELPTHLYRGAQSTILLDSRSELKSLGRDDGGRRTAIFAGKALLVAAVVLVALIAIAASSAPGG